MLPMLVLAVSMPLSSTGQLPSTQACTAKAQAARDHFAISNLKLGKSVHPVSSSASEYLDLSDRMADAMRAPGPDLVLIRKMSRQLVYRRLSITTQKTITAAECNLDLAERSKPGMQQYALSLIAPATKARREATKTKPPEWLVGKRPDTSHCNAMGPAVIDRWAISFGGSSDLVSSEVSEYLDLYDKLEEAMRAPSPDFVLIQTMSRDLARRRFEIDNRAALLDAECDLDEVERTPPGERSSRLLRIAPPTKAERQSSNAAPPPGPYIQHSAPTTSSPK